MKKRFHCFRTEQEHIIEENKVSEIIAEEVTAAIKEMKDGKAPD